MKHYLVALFLFFLSSSVFAIKVSISHQSQVMLKSEPKENGEIIKILNDGGEADLLKPNVGNGYSKIRLENNEVAYVLTKYLSVVSENIDSGDAKDNGNHSQQDNESASLIFGNDSIEAIFEEKQQKNKNRVYINSLEKQKEQLSNDNQKLNEDMQKLLLQLDVMRIENKNLQSQGTRKNWLVGGGLVVLGLLLGCLLSLSGKSQKRSSWGR